MDLRSTPSGEVAHPRGALEALGQKASVRFPNLAAARERTTRRLDEVRSALEDLELAPGQAVVLFGSWGRSELTPGSDDDWALVSNEPLVEGHQLWQALAGASRVLGGEGRAPGTQRIFGGAFELGEVLGNVGLQADTNTNTTRRLLLLLESVPAAGAGYAAAWDLTFDRYLRARGEQELLRAYRPPRFLLNDLVRYWRTICVDFEAKAAAGTEKWAARSAKLRTSRKMLFAGGLIPLLRCRAWTADDARAFLRQQFGVPPSDRLAQAFLDLDAIGEGVRALNAYDRWLGLLADSASRARLDSLTRERAYTDELFDQVREISAEFERGLLALMYDTALGPVTRQYGLF